MHIAYVLGYIAERYGGPPNSVRGLGKTIASHGMNVSYWATADASGRAELATLGPEVRLYETTWPHSCFRSPMLSRELACEINSIDLLHIQELWSYPQYCAARLGRRYDTPYIITPRGVLEPWRIRHKGYGKFIKKKAYLALVGLSMLQGAACLHAITPNEIEGFRQVGYDGPVTIIPNGVNPDDYRQLPNGAKAEAFWPVLAGRRVVLFLSRLSREKGLAQLLPALSGITEHKAYDDVLLVIAGPDLDGYQRVVENLVEKYGLNNHVLLTGMVQAQKKFALMSRADIYALPSYSEGFSMSLLENLAAGTPVLITPGCNFSEVVRANAGLCVPPEPCLLDEGLRTLLDMSPAEREAMGQRGRNLILQNYTWGIAASKMITVYRCILEGKDTPLNPKPFQTS